MHPGSGACYQHEEYFLGIPLRAGYSNSREPSRVLVVYFAEAGHALPSTAQQRLHALTTRVEISLSSVQSASASSLLSYS